MYVIYIEYIVMTIMYCYYLVDVINKIYTWFFLRERNKVFATN